MGNRKNGGTGPSGRTKAERAAIDKRAKEWKRPKPSAKPAEARTVEALNDDQLQTLFFQHKKKLKALIASQKIAATAVKEAYALAKAEGVSKKEIEIALGFETEDGEKRAAADAERIYRVARWMGVAIGTQADLFEGAAKHHEAGKRAAMSDEPRKPPTNLSNKDSQAWMEGFNEGLTALNASRAAQFKPLGDQPSTMRPQ